jgi:hypothetical protein
VLGAKEESPEYAAVIEWLPEARVDVVKVALPGNTTVGVPRTVAPSEKVTVPVGYPTIGGGCEIVAVSVTDWPGADGLADEVTTTDVVFLMTCERGADLLGWKDALPP